MSRHVPAAQAGLVYAGFPHITVVRSTPTVPGLVPAYSAQSQGQMEVSNTDGGRGGQATVKAAAFDEPPNIPLPVAPGSGPRRPVETWQA
jgi:hypothetical protein